MIEEFRRGLLRTFGGLPVFEFNFTTPEEVAGGEVPSDVEAWAWRIAVEDAENHTFPAVLELFLKTVDASRVKALIVGYWLEDYDVEDGPSVATEPLIANAARFTALESLFVGDMDSQQAEVSWIHQDDPAPLLAAFPALREFGLRGTSELAMGPLKHTALRELTFQGGGLPPEVARAIGDSELPSLTHLELYLGERWYSGGSVPEDYRRILRGEAFPRLRHLGLRDAANQDEIAAAVAHAPVVAQLDSLDLSLGTLTDEGATALLSGQPLTHLTSLDLHHHYLSEEMMQRVWAALPGVAVNLDEQETPDVWETSNGPEEDGPQREVHRYIAVAE
ncbi:MAG TPA: STM4015 family protein [Actinospica sp.]|nr:STM4015 family protein [Actinospica sp.]